MRKYALSPSTLNIFLKCPRCFWLHMNLGVKRPRGIFPSLPTGIDAALKKYFDKYRIANELPPELCGKIDGKLFPDLNVLEKWRSWKSTNLFYEDASVNAILSGALDDCLIHGEYYMPLDYKTRGSALINDPRIYYQTQLDCYCLMLDSRGYKTNGIAYLIYYWPSEIKENGLIQFTVQHIKIETNIETAKSIVKEAVNILLSKIPKANENCEFCTFVQQRKIDESY